MPKTLYYVNGSAPSRSALMTFKAIGVDVEKRSVDLMRGEQKEEWFVKMNPKHCVPTLDDDGFYLWESRAIMRYAMNAYAPGNSMYPTDPKKRAIVDRVLDQDLGSLYKEVGGFVYPQLFMGKSAPDDKDLRARLHDLETLSLLAHDKYIAGDDVTIADISVFNTVTFLETVHYDLSAYPKVGAWIGKMKAKPYVAEVNVLFDEFKQAMAARQQTK